MADFLERRIGDVVVRIDRLLCVGFADCMTGAPEAFRLDAEGVAEFGEESDTVPRERLLEACRACPVDALSVVTLDGSPLVE